MSGLLVVATTAGEGSSVSASMNSTMTRIVLAALSTCLRQHGFRRRGQLFERPVGDLFILCTYRRAWPALPRRSMWGLDGDLKRFVRETTISVQRSVASENWVLDANLA